MPEPYNWDDTNEQILRKRIHMERSVNNRGPLRLVERRSSQKWSVNKALSELANHEREDEEMAYALKWIIRMTLATGLVAWGVFLSYLIKPLF